MKPVIRSLSQTPLSKSAALVKVSKAGQFDGYRTFTPRENEETFLRIQLLAKKETGAVDAAAGGEVTTGDGGKVALQAAGVVVASNGAVYTGQVHVSARWVNPSDIAGAQMDKPGDSRGTDKEGNLKLLQSYGIMDVELTGDNGQLLQIAGGKTATLTIPIPAAISSNIPENIDLWSLNDTTGLWKQEAQATRNGSFFIGTVSHFSFWDAAIGAPLVNFKAKVVNVASQPLANIPVSITMAGRPVNAGFTQFGYTDGDGNVSGAVIANADLVLDILTPCAISAYSHNFSTQASEVDLGTLTGQLGQNQVTLSGTVTNCNNQPVTNGYVQTYDHGFYNRINITNGSFFFTGVVCTNIDVNVVAIDNTTNQQGAPQTVTLHPGANDLGALTACGISTAGSIIYTIDGVPATITEPVERLDGYWLTPNNDLTLVVSINPNSNESQKISFQFDGGTGTGSAHHLSEVFSVGFPSGRGYWPVPVVVNITAYDKIGGFITGNFNSNMLDFNDNSLHTMECSFRVRRRS